MSVPALVAALRGTAAIGWRRWALWVAAAKRIWRVVERPTRRRVLAFVPLANIAAPAFTGVIDLALRARTP